MQKVLPEIKELNAELIAICPQRPEFLRQMREKHSLEFDILYDKGNKVAERFGLRYTLPKFLQEVYLDFDLDLPRVNGEDSWTLPMPARYLVRSDSTIFAADYDPDYRYRPEPQKTLEDLRRLCAK